MGALFVCTLVWALAAGAETVGVAQVIDGDSLRLRDGRQLRLIGVNTPEFGKVGKPDEPLADAAREFLARLIAGQALRIDYGMERLDRYRRTLAHAYLPDGTNLQTALLRAGMAVAIAIPPNLTHLDEYLRAETEARRARRGVWGHPYFTPRAATGLTVADTGFAFVAGRVQRVGQGRYSIYLDLGDHVSIVIPRKHWHYFGGEPTRFAGKRVVARGWVTGNANRLRLRLSHPSMLEMVD